MRFMDKPCPAEWRRGDLHLTCANNAIGHTMHWAVIEDGEPSEGSLTWDEIDRTPRATPEADDPVRSHPDPYWRGTR